MQISKTGQTAEIPQRERQPLTGTSQVLFKAIGLGLLLKSLIQIFTKLHRGFQFIGTD
jgi:hypothetical protein